MSIQSDRILREVVDSSARHGNARSAGASAMRVRSRHPRRGVALMLVMSVVAVAGVLSWAMLSASSLRAQVDANVNDSIQSRYIADSGVSYALYYLRHPAKSPVALVNGPFNHSFYPGQNGVTLWSDADGPVNISVVNTALNTFVVTSTAIVDGMKQTTEAEVLLETSGYKVATAASFNGNFTMPSQMTITGPVSILGTLSDLLGGVISLLGGSSVTVTTTEAAPIAANVKLLSETGITASTGGTDRTYTMNGNTYIAEQAPATITGTLMTSRPALNPANVWYSDNAVVLNAATINGTLVLRGAGLLDLTGTNTVNASSPKMPALVVNGNVRQKHQLTKPAKLNVAGVAWVGGSFTVANTSLSPGGLNITGSLLMGGPAPAVTGLTGPVDVAFNNAVSNVSLTTETQIDGLSISRWTRRQN